MKLTKEEAIRRHRMMWEWIGNSTLRTHRCVDKLDAFHHFGWDTYDTPAKCWCCKYSADIGGGCDRCPIVWPSKSDDMKCVYSKKESNGYDGLYDMWSSSVTKNDWRTAAYYALYISMLPERKD